MDDDDSNSSDNDNDDDNHYWDVITCIAASATEYYSSYVDKKPCLTSDNTGASWIGDLLRGHPERCRRMMRMEVQDFLNLCNMLENSYGLTPSVHTSVIEKVGLFIYILAQGASNRQTQERFQHSGETVSRIFYEVLEAVNKLGSELINPVDREFKEIPQQLLNDRRYMPHFKDCIGAIDGTHIEAVVPIHKQLSFIGRKGRPTQNVMAVCSFDLQFTYALAGFEGSAHDNRVLMHAIRNPQLNFPFPPPGKYYLVDAGYSQMSGYLGPYRGVRYHLPEYQRGQPPQGLKEVFNKAHSSLRSCIERCFGIWKKRWNILRDMPSYPFKTQVRIVFATMTLHNYIRRTSTVDEIFHQADTNPNSLLEASEPDDESHASVEESSKILSQNERLRNQISLRPCLAGRMGGRTDSFRGMGGRTDEDMCV